MQNERIAIDRRLFLKGAALSLLGFTVFGWDNVALGATASQETLNALNSAQAEYEAAMAELQSIGYQLEQAQYQLEECQANLDATNQQISDLEVSITEKQGELNDAQDVLAERVNASYHAGTSDVLSVLLDATSFEDFVNRLYYAGKVNESDQDAIQQVKDLKAELESQEAQLQEQRVQQEQLLADQQTYTQDLQSTVSYYESYTAGLSAEVTSLMNQAQQELIAAQQAEYEAYLAQQQQQQQQQGTSGNGGSSSTGSSNSNGSGSTGSTDSGSTGSGSTGSTDSGSSSETTPAPSPDGGAGDSTGGDTSGGQPSYDEPNYDEPSYDEPSYDEPTYDEPVYDEPSYDEPVYDEPVYSGGNHVYSVADIAWNYVGVPYVYGGSDPSGFDCSGLAQYCYAQAGYSIPRTTYSQIARIEALGQMVYSMDQLRPGDLLFPHSGHVGIYMGGGMMIDAPYPGEVVQYRAVWGFSCGGCPV